MERNWKEEEEQGLNVEALKEQQEDVWTARNEMFYDRDGNEINMRTWTDLRINNANPYASVITSKTEKHWISTVWLGLNMNHFSGGPPLIFETAIFSNDGKVDVFERYPTEKLARAGHAKAVEQTKQKETDESN